MAATMSHMRDLPQWSYKPADCVNFTRLPVKDQWRHCSPCCFETHCASLSDADSATALLHLVKPVRGLARAEAIESKAHRVSRYQAAETKLHGKLNMRRVQ